MRYSIKKLLPVMFCFFWGNGFGQKTVNHKADSSKKGYVFHDEASVLPNVLLYIIDDKEIPDSLASSNYVFKNLSPNDILEISIVKGIEADAIYGIRGARGVVIITTKKYAIAQYQKRLSAFSTEYKSYIESIMKYNHNDNDVMYVYLKNNDPVFLDRYEMIKTLYNTSADSIEKVELKRQVTCWGTNISVIITTKK
jgi:TonB-dependent SusC/RagA subfamily outer membrane receptor